MRLGLCLSARLAAVRAVRHSYLVGSGKEFPPPEFNRKPGQNVQEAFSLLESTLNYRVRKINSSINRNFL